MRPKKRSAKVVKVSRIFASKQRDSEATNDDLHNLIKLLKPGDLVEVLWLDASIARDRRISQLKNQDFATYKRSVGYYVGILIDHRYKREFVLISPEKTDEGEIHEAQDIESIPLGIVMKIVRVGDKVAQRTIKGRKLVRTFVRTGKLKWAQLGPLDDGGVKLILAKEVKE